jgi:hypothetical protein
VLQRLREQLHHEQRCLRENSTARVSVQNLQHRKRHGGILIADVAGEM